ncbi:hypothetical protein PG996_014005 [Apiospora saccharicola]|uniref:Uncharacterized protein n=1 Tax=Apiospora saccharicola TaxID=335842 RepID=A0ABR1TH20_9PEZI
MKLQTPIVVVADDTHVVERLECPAEGGKPCRLPGPKEYHITVRPYIAFSATTVHGGEYDAHDLADDEAEAIYRLVEKEYNDYEAANPRNKNGTNSVTRDSRRIQFVPLSGLVSTAELTRSDDDDDDWFEVEAGKWAELGWNAYHAYALGVLGGCTNESLNDKVAQVAAPYAGQKQNATQLRLLDGQWMQTSDNLTSERDEPERSKDDPESGAAMLAMGLFGESAWEVVRSWAMVGSGVLVMGFVL